MLFGLCQISVTFLDPVSVRLPSQFKLMRLGCVAAAVNGGRGPVRAPYLRCGSVSATGPNK